jgi:hypothetical protein
MPLLEQFYYPAVGEGGPLFAGNSLDPRNNATIAAGEDTVTIKGVICAQSIVPLYSDGLPNGVGFAGATLDLKYRPCDTVRVVGWNTELPSPGGPFLPKPPELAVTPSADPTYGAPFVVFVEPNGNIQVGSFDTFSAFFEPVSVNFTYIACDPTATENPDPVVPGTAGGAPGPFGVRKVSR